MFYSRISYLAISFSFLYFLLAGCKTKNLHKGEWVKIEYIGSKDSCAKKTVKIADNNMKIGEFEYTLEGIDMVESSYTIDSVIFKNTGRLCYTYIVKTKNDTYFPFFFFELPDGRIKRDRVLMIDGFPKEKLNDILNKEGESISAGAVQGEIYIEKSKAESYMNLPAMKDTSLANYRVWMDSVLVYIDNNQYDFVKNLYINKWELLHDILVKNGFNPYKSEYLLKGIETTKEDRKRVQLFSELFYQKWKEAYSLYGKK